MFWIDYLWRHYITKKCEHPKKYWTIRHTIDTGIYYICPICLKGWFIDKEKVDEPKTEEEEKRAY